MKLPKLVFAGLGNMGLPMARNLKWANWFEVLGFDVN